MCLPARDSCALPASKYFKRQPKSGAGLPIEQVGRSVSCQNKKETSGGQPNQAIAFDGAGKTGCTSDQPGAKWTVSRRRDLDRPSKATRRAHKGRRRQ
jgi:hypothetical protein